MFIASAVTFVTQSRQPARTTDRTSSTARRWQVLKVLVPTVVFVVLIRYLGIYVPAALFIAFFMWWLGNIGF